MTLPLSWILSMLTKLTRQIPKRKCNEVPASIKEIIVRALDALGSWQWPGNYEVVRLSPVSWCVQPHHLAVPPIGRYVITVRFAAYKPSCFEIIHSDGRIGVATSRTYDLRYEVLVKLLHQIYEEFGPALLVVPFH